MDRAVMDNLFTTQGWQQHFENCIKEGLDVDSTSYDDGWTLLHYAMEAENYEAVDWLIRNGANINTQDDNGWSVLHCTIRAEIELAQAAEMPIDFRGVQLLINNGAQVDIKTKQGNTPRDVAASFGVEALEQYDKLLN